MLGIKGKANQAKKGHDTTRQKKGRVRMDRNEKGKVVET